MSHPRLWATGNTRDEYIDGSPARAHIAHMSAIPLHAFTCVRTGCTAKVDSVELYCALHLWTFDNPVLRDASIFQ